jgi:sugar lactone lactonase YvrE
MKLRILSSIFVLSLAIVSYSQPALGKCKPGTVRIFEVEGIALEGITVTKDGTIYASGDETGKIFKRTTSGIVTEVASFWDDGSGTVLGLTSDPNGNVYAAVNHWSDEAINGVWQIGRDDTVELHAALPISLLNGITIDERRNLYVSDSYAGSIWKVSRTGEIELWVQDELLMDSWGFGFGINGVDYYRHAIYASITLDGRIVKIPINRDGGAGTPESYVEDIALFGVDHAILDRFGNLYAVNVFMHSIVKVDTELEVATLIENSDDVYKPASLSLGARGNQFSIYFTNYENAYDWFPPPPDPPNVADVTRLDLCSPGLQP